MKKRTLFLFSLLSMLTVKSQYVVSNQGDSYSNSIGGLDFTIGEVVTNTVSNGEKTLTQGFHQTNWSFVNIENHVPSYEAIIFPNPTEEFLNIKASLYENISYLLYDEMGKLILKGNLLSEETALELSPLATGRYSLILSNGKENLKTFNIIKTR